MGAETSKNMENQPELDGRPVTFHYKRAEQGQDGQISWHEGRVSCTIDRYVKCQNRG